MCLFCSLNISFFVMSLFLNFTSPFLFLFSYIFPFINVIINTTFCSWGTGGRSHRSSYQPRQPTPKSTRRPEGVPGLSLVGDGAEAYGKPEPPVKKVKQVTAIGVSMGIWQCFGSWEFWMCQDGFFKKKSSLIENLKT